MTTEGQGKYIRYKTPTSEDSGDIALIPTILSAISHSTDGSLRISKKDYRIKIKRKKISTHTLIVLDTSSSMIEGNKLRIAKKCLKEIFLDTYQKRDRIAIITAGGEQAEYLLPFTSNIEKGRTLVDSISFGGTTPLPSGIRTGLHLLEDLMRKEPWMVPIMIVITDGGANVPISVGGNVHDEFDKLSSEMNYNNITPLIIQVGEESHMCKDMVWKTKGKYISIGEGGERFSLDLDKEMEVEDIFHRALLTLAQNKTTHSAFLGYSSDAIMKVRDILEKHPVYTKVNEDCHYGCWSNDIFVPLCRECSLRAEGNIKKMIRPVGIGWISEHQRTSDLLGELFVRYVVNPGTLMKANGGLLFVENERTYDKFSNLLEGCLDMKKCEVSNEEYTESYPFKPRGVLLCMEEDYVDLPKKYDVLSWDRNVYNKLWKVKAEKEMKIDPEKFIEKMEEDRKQKIDMLNRFITGDMSLEVPDYISNTVYSSLGTEKSYRVIKLMNTFALLKGKNKVDLDDLEDTVEFTGINLEKKENNSSQYLFSKLAMVLSAREDLRLTLVEGYTKNDFDEAIDLLSKLPLTIKVNRGCISNCDPLSMDPCPECKLRGKVEEIETEEIPLPIVRIKGNESLEELRGDLFVKYILTSDTLLRANRGLLVIESIQEMDDDVIEFMKDLLKNGTFKIRNQEYSQSFKIDLSVIAFKDSRMMNKLIDQSLGHIIKKESYEDILPSILTNDNSENILARLTERVERVKDRLTETHVQDELLDYIVRACLELKIGRFDAEAKIEKLSRVISVWNGNAMTDETIDQSIHNLAPILLRKGTNL
ncbi:MAG: VWA domain-containing protein [Thermoplasmata archaeon]